MTGIWEIALLLPEPLNELKPFCIMIRTTQAVNNQIKPWQVIKTQQVITENSRLEKVDLRSIKDIFQRSVPTTK